MTRLPLLLLLVLLAFPASASATIRIGSAPSEATEGETISLTLVRDGSLDTSVNVGALIDRRATAPPLDGLLRGTPDFAIGQDTATIKAYIPNDPVMEPATEMYVRLMGRGIDPTTRPILVHDDDAEFAATDATVDESAGVARLAIRRLDPALTVTAHPKAIAGTATLEDFTNPPEAVTLPAGTLAGTIDVPITRDRIAETNETFRVELSNLNVGGQAITVNINEDRTAPAGRLAGRRTARLGPALLFTASSPETAAVALDLRIDAATAKRLKAPRVLARKAAQAVAGAPVPIRLRLAAATVRKLRRGRRVTAIASATFTDAAGNHRTVTRRITLTR